MQLKTDLPQLRDAFSPRPLGRSMQLIPIDEGLSATFALALAIPSLPFTVQMGARAFGETIIVEHKGYWHLVGCK